MSKLLLQVPNTNEKCHIILSSEHNHNNNPSLLRRSWRKKEPRAKAPRHQGSGTNHILVYIRHRSRIIRANQCSLFLSKFHHLDFSIGDFGTIKPWLTAYMANLEIESKPDLSSIEVMCCFTIDSDMFKFSLFRRALFPDIQN